MRWEEIIPGIQEVLTKHFEEVTASVAEEIYDEWVAADAMQKLERSDRFPSEDKRNLELAAKQIDQASEKLRRTGWHGDKALAPMVARVAFADRQQQTSNLMDAMSAVAFLSKHLAEIASSLRTAASEIDEDGGSVVAALDATAAAGFARGRPRETAARWVASKCAEIYFQQTGSQPSVIVPFAGGPAYGPFLEFVSDMFRAVGISASPENHAKEASKEKIGRLDN